MERIQLTVSFPSRHRGQLLCSELPAGESYASKNSSSTWVSRQWGFSPSPCSATPQAGPLCPDPSWAGLGLGVLHRAGAVEPSLSCCSLSFAPQS